MKIKHYFYYACVLMMVAAPAVGQPCIYDGLIRVCDDHGKYGFIDKTGKVVIPCKWKDVGWFSDGLAIVRDDNEKYGIIDKTGKMITPCMWSCIAGYDFDYER